MSSIIGRITASNQVRTTLINDTPATTNQQYIEKVFELGSSNIGTAGQIAELHRYGDQMRKSIESQTQASQNQSLEQNGFAREATVTRFGNTIIVDAGDGDDQISINQNSLGQITVSVNGEQQTFSGADVNKLEIQGGDGNDRITIGSSVKVQLRIVGGAGDDIITVDHTVTAQQQLFGGDGNDQITGGSGHDKIEGGDGDDVIDGGDGDDYINGSTGNDQIRGGAGKDVIYGGAGNDQVDGGADDDYLEGGAGEDELVGGEGDDVLSGGRDNDQIDGGAGNDVIYTGHGKDKVNGRAGSNRIFSQAEDVIEPEQPGASRNQVVTIQSKQYVGGTSIRIEGSAEFQERVIADMNLLRSSPRGQQMLEALDAAAIRDGVIVTILESRSFNSTADWPKRQMQNWPQQPYLRPDPYSRRWTFNRGAPNDAIIHYSTNAMLQMRHRDGITTDCIPIIKLFHEMAHAYGFTHGTVRIERYTGNDWVDADRINAEERVAVGLPIDHDGMPLTPEQTDDSFHPKGLTENGLREEMNLSFRQHYDDIGLTRE